MNVTHAHELNAVREIPVKKVALAINLLIKQNAAVGDDAVTSRRVSMGDAHSIGTLRWLAHRLVSLCTMRLHKVETTPAMQVIAPCGCMILKVLCKWFDHTSLLSVTTPSPTTRQGLEAIMTPMIDNDHQGSGLRALFTFFHNECVKTFNRLSIVRVEHKRDRVLFGSVRDGHLGSTSSAENCQAAAAIIANRMPAHSHTWYQGHVGADTAAQYHGYRPIMAVVDASINKYGLEPMLAASAARKTEVDIQMQVVRAVCQELDPYGQFMLELKDHWLPTQRDEVGKGNRAYDWRSRHGLDHRALVLEEMASRHTKAHHPDVKCFACTSHQELRA